ncbi:MAG: hypothetical protein ACJ8AW_09745 [Rhodopila sp.]
MTITTGGAAGAAAASPMLTALLNMLTPLLMAAGLTDPAARQAIVAAMAGYAADGETQLLVASQIVGYSLSGLDTLRVSADIAVPELLIALRGTAARMASSAARAERSLAVQQRATSPPTDLPETACAEPDESAVLAALAATTAQVQAAQAAAVQPSRPDPGPAPGAPTAPPPNRPSARPCRPLRLRRDRMLRPKRWKRSPHDLLRKRREIRKRTGSTS